jgi:ATP-binding cassette, subfamily B, multidrug efflux pump
MNRGNGHASDGIRTRPVATRPALPRSGARDVTLSKRMHELKPILPFLRPYRSAIGAGLLLVVVSNALGVLVPALLGRAIDAMTVAGVTLGTIVSHALLIVGVALVSGAARFGMRQILNGSSRRVETDLRRAFFEHLLRMDRAFFAGTRTGDLIARATNDTQAVRMAIGPGVMYLVNTVVMTAFVLFFMIRYSPSLAALALMPLLLLPAAMLYFGRVIHRRFEGIQHHFGALTTMVQEHLAGVRIVRAYGQEAAQQEEFRELSREYAARNMALARTTAVFHPLLALLAGLGLLIVLWFGGLQVIDGRLSAGEFVAFGLYLGLLTWPMIALGWVINLFQRGAASMGRLNRILSHAPGVREPDSPAPLAAVNGEIEFRNVWFRYPGTERWVLHDVSFTLAAGTTAALVGPTGAGKSTIAALLARHYDPDRGEILLDGVPLHRLPLGTLRAAFGFVPQDAFVFSETLADNIAFGLGDEATDRAARVRHAAGVAQLTATIAAFPRGFETRLGERGINLSGGQRQRVTLARAIAREPRIIVLDDALSAVDTQTEAAILHGLRDVLQARTALVISHRVSAVMDADAIFVIDEGRIVESGRHAELIRRGGVYARLLRRQLLEKGLEDELAAAEADV